MSQNTQHVISFAFDYTMKRTRFTLKFLLDVDTFTIRFVNLDSDDDFDEKSKDQLGLSCAKLS